MSSQTTQQKPKQKKKKVKPNKPGRNVNAAKRRGQYKGKQNIRAEAIKENNLVTPVKALVPAQGVQKAIIVDVVMANQSIKLVPAGLVSLSMVRGLNQECYSFYRLMFADVVNLLEGGTGTVPSRLEYQNAIFGSLVPKSIPFRLDCTINYNIQPITVTPTDLIPAGSGHAYYLYNPSSNFVSGYFTQLPQLPPAPEVDSKIFIDALERLADKPKHTQMTRNVNLTPQYLKDISAFARNSPYFGVSGGACGAPYASVEAEVPFKSNLLGTLIPFQVTTPRASRVLTKSSGDSCSNYAIGSLPCFPTSYYKGAVPPIYKFLDIAEVAYTAIYALFDATKKYIAAYPNPGDDFFLDNGFSFTYQQFLLMLRQQILWMFADSQCLAQFLAPDTGSTSWEAFLCGSNCYPCEPPSKLRISSVLNENLKMLKMVVRPYDTKKYKNNRNHITHIPVWGAFLQYQQDINFTYRNREGVNVNLFRPTSPAPDIWDGTFGNDVVDLNNAPVLDDTVTEWNQWMNQLQQMWSSQEAIGGDAANSPLLQFTRYVKFTPVVEKIVAENRVVPDFLRYHTNEKKVERIEKPKMERVNSKELTKNYTVERVTSIIGSTVLLETTLNVSGMIPITASHKQYIPDLIMPVIDLTQGDNPSLQQIQTSAMEPYSLDKREIADILNASRAAEITASVSNHVTGTAGHKTALASYMQTLADNNQGAFLGDLFATVGNVTNSLGIPVVGEVANVVGGIANMFGI